MNPFQQGPRVGLDPNVTILPISACRYLKGLVDPMRTPKFALLYIVLCYFACVMPKASHDVSKWNRGGGGQVVIGFAPIWACRFHVAHYLFALGGQLECVFWWNLGILFKDQTWYLRLIPYGLRGKLDRHAPQRIRPLRETNLPVLPHHPPSRHPISTFQGYIARAF